MGSELRYWGFISYSHADERLARRLHGALEGYALPARLRRAHGLPRRLIPIFRDVDELEAASELNERLQSALDQSRWLIVLCSPASAKSRYVNDEIRYFAKKHGASRILFALAEGTPAESFPPAIRELEREPLAADFREGQDFELGRLKLVAAMATVGFAELRNREAQRKRRQRIVASAAAAAITIGGVIAWDLLAREQSEFYANYVRKHGVWHGIGRLGAEAATHRMHTWRFARRGRLSPPYEVKFVDGRGECPMNTYYEFPFRDILGGRVRPSGLGDAQPNRDYCVARFAYAEDGSVRSETLWDSLGIERFGLVYTTPTLAQITRNGFADVAGSGGIRYLEFNRDERGRNHEIRYLFSSGRPRRDEYFAYGFRHNFGPDDQVTQSVTLDSRFQPTDRVEQVDFSAQGALTELRFVDSAGAPRLSTGGSARIRWEYDEWGNVTRREFYDKQGLLTAGLGFFAVETFEYGAFGDLVKNCAFDSAQQPVAVPRFGHCEHWFRDARGRYVKREQRDAAGGLLREADAPSVWGFTWDDSNNVVAQSDQDADGRPATYFVSPRLRMQYDARGNPVAGQFLDGDGKPVMSPWGAGFKQDLDDRDRRVSLIWVGLDGKPVYVANSAAAIRTYAFDDNGNTHRECWLGEDGRARPIKGLHDIPEGFECIERSFDDAGNAIETRYADESGRVVMNTLGFARIRRKFNALGQEIEKRYYDEAGLPVKTRLGHGTRQVVGEWGQVIEHSWLDVDGSRTKGPGGFATARYSDFLFTDFGGVMHRRAEYLDARDQVMARETRVLDFRGIPLEVQHFDARGLPSPDPVTGCATYRAAYQGLKQLSSEDCLGPDGKPVNRKDLGYATHRITLENLLPVKDEYFDAAGKPVKPKN